MQLVLENRSRFSDDVGRPLPFVQELSRYVSSLNDKFGNQASPKAKNNKTTASSSDENKQKQSEMPVESKDSYPEKDYPEYKGKG